MTKDELIEIESLFYEGQKKQEDAFLELFAIVKEAIDERQRESSSSLRDREV